MDFTDTRYVSIKVCYNVPRKRLDILQRQQKFVTVTNKKTLNMTNSLEKIRRDKQRTRKNKKKQEAVIE